MRKYKLINTNTKEEHLCDKVTIDGFEYYVSDEDLGINKPFWGYCWNWHDKINYFDNGLNEYARGRKGIQKVIATTNPNINVPKVLDEEDIKEYVALSILKKQDWDTSTNLAFNDGFIKGYKKSQETDPFSEEDVKEIFKIAQMQKNYGDYKPYTFEEAIQLWKEQQPKIVYYE